MRTTLPTAMFAGKEGTAAFNARPPVWHPVVATGIESNLLFEMYVARTNFLFHHAARGAISLHG